MDLRTGLLAFYSLEEDAANTDVSDDVGSYDATSSTNTSNLSATGLVGDAFDFTAASSESVDCGDIAIFKNSSYSINFWVKTTAASGRLISEGASASANPYYRIFLETGKVKVALRDSGGSTDVETITGSAVNDGDWHMVTAVQDGGSSFQFYLDGSSSGSEDTSSNPTDDTDKTVLAAGYSNGSYESYYDGLLDQVAIYNIALSQAQITALYNSGSGLSYANMPIDHTEEISGDLPLTLTDNAPSINVTYPPSDDQTLTLTVNEPTLSGVEPSMTVAGTSGTRIIRTSHPKTSGIVGKYTKQKGRTTNLVPKGMLGKKRTTSKRNDVGL